MDGWEIFGDGLIDGTMPVCVCSTIIFAIFFYLPLVGLCCVLLDFQHFQNFPPRKCIVLHVCSFALL